MARTRVGADMLLFEYVLALMGFRTLMRAVTSCAVLDFGPIRGDLSYHNSLGWAHADACLNWRIFLLPTSDDASISVLPH